MKLLYIESFRFVSSESLSLLMLLR